MYAVIKTGGKQYRVKEGDVLSVERFEAEKGQTINLDKVLLVEDGNNIQVGRPYLERAVVKAEVLENYKDEKVIVFKKKRRKGYRRTKGHRQLLTKIKITGIFPETAVVEEEKPKAEAVTAAPKRARKKETSEAQEKPATKKTARAPRTTEKKATKKSAKED